MILSYYVNDRLETNIRLNVPTHPLKAFQPSDFLSIYPPLRRILYQLVSSTTSQPRQERETMAEPFSIVAGVFDLSAIAVKLIISFSSYVDSVRGAKADVQALSVDISTTYTILGELKLKLDGDSGAGSQLASDPLATVQRVLEHCKYTLLGLERMVEKAQVVELESGMERMVKTVRWKFKDGEIKKYKAWLREDKANLQMIMQVLSQYEYPIYNCC